MKKKKKIAHILGASDNVDYVLSSQDDGMVAYRIVAMSDEDTKPSIAPVNNYTTTMPQQLQYIVIDNVNGYLQAVSTQIAITSSTTASISSNSSSSNTTTSMSVPMGTSRPSVTIAPKIAKIETGKYINTVPASNNKQSVRIFDYIYIDFH